MKSLQSIDTKRSAKQERERHVLLGLIEHYLKTGKPVGSQTLKEAGFDSLSSATIRNYFANLEKEGFLEQQHTSGGRIPTEEAYRLYADAQLNAPITEEKKQPFESLRTNETREISAYLQDGAERLAKYTNLAVFISAPKFDHDFVVALKLVPIDQSRCLCILVTDFGVIQTELMHLDKKLSTLSAKRIEAYFHWRLTGLDKPETLEPDEEAIAHKFYNELMMRYIVGYSTYIDEDIYRTGFSRLLNYPDFLDTAALAHTLALFENAHSMRLLLKECCSADTLKYWIGKDLDTYSKTTPDCTVLAIPYRINQRPVGAVGILGPTRIPYRDLFHILTVFSESISEALTRSIYKFKISYREPQRNPSYSEEHQLIHRSRLMLLEDKREVNLEGDHAP